MMEFRLTVEPSGQRYHTLIDLLGAACPMFLLVRREQLALSPEGRNVLERLEPYRIRSERGNSWPGTELIGHFAQVSYFECTPAALAVLKHAAESLFGWVEPLPEDLCFLDSAGVAVLTSVAHEREAWVRAEGALPERLRAALGAEVLAGAG